MKEYFKQVVVTGGVLGIVGLCGMFTALNSIVSSLESQMASEPSYLRDMDFSSYNIAQPSDIQGSPSTVQVTAGNTRHSSIGAILQPVPHQERLQRTMNPQLQTKEN